MARRFNLTPRVKEDLRAIWQFGCEVWGEKKAEGYVAAIYERFEWLARQPQIGKHRPDIKDGYYCFPQGSHLIFYLINEDCIDLIGVLHKRMDVINYFGDWGDKS